MTKKKSIVWYAAIWVNLKQGHEKYSCNEKLFVAREKHKPSWSDYFGLAMFFSPIRAKKLLSLLLRLTSPQKSESELDSVNLQVRIRWPNYFSCYGYDRINDKKISFVNVKL